MAGKYGIGDEVLKGTLTPGTGTSLGMRFADSTDRMFREAVFFEALARGRTPEQASELAKTVLLDYGAMPGAAQETLGKAFLYMSFTWMMGQEVTLSLADPKKFRVLVSQLNYHRKVSEDIFGQQTEMLDNMFYREIGALNEKDATAFKVYYRNPVIGSFKTVAEIAEGGRQMQIMRSTLKEAAKTPQVMKAGLDGVLDIGYNPYLDVLRKVQMEYKKPLPEKVVYQISSLPTSGPLSGPAAMEYFGIEYIPVDKRIVGKAEVGVDRYYVDPNTGIRTKMDVDQLERGIDTDGDGEIDVQPRGGYQMRFKTPEGYAKFVAMQQMIQFAGYGRLMNDITGMLIAAEALPKGTTFGYSEKGNPVFYLAGREKIIRVPKEMEKYDRQVRQYERDLIEFMEGFE
jgi:hypothetical protein